MTGIVYTSADGRLKSTMHTDETDEEVNSTQVILLDAKEVKESMMKIIELAMNGEELENICSNAGKVELFHSFVNYCLIHFTTSMNWKYKASDSLVSDIFTESDESLCILLLENNAYVNP